MVASKRERLNELLASLDGKVLGLAEIISHYKMRWRFQDIVPRELSQRLRVYRLKKKGNKYIIDKEKIDKYG